MGPLNKSLFAEYASWVVLEKDERVPRTKKEWARLHDVTEITLQNWDKRMSGSGDGDEIKNFMEQVYNQAMKSNATSNHMTLYAKLKGILVEKSEQKVNIDINPDQIAKAVSEALRGLLEGGYGESEMRKEFSILSNEFCLDKRSYIGNN